MSDCLGVSEPTLIDQHRTWLQFGYTRILLLASRIRLLKSLTELDPYWLCCDASKIGVFGIGGASRESGHHAHGHGTVSVHSMPGFSQCTNQPPTTLQKMRL